MFGMDLHASICTSPYKVVAKDAQILLASASVPRELQEHLTITTAPGQGRSQAVSDWSPPASGPGLGLERMWWLEGGLEFKCVGKREWGQSRETVKEGRGCSFGSPQSKGLERKGPRPLVF